MGVGRYPTRTRFGFHRFVINKRLICLGAERPRRFQRPQWLPRKIPNYKPDTTYFRYDLVRRVTQIYTPPAEHQGLIGCIDVYYGYPCKTQIQEWCVE